MKSNYNKVLLASLSLIAASPAFAGNKDRSGQSGASELLINPWAQSTGVFGLDVANVRGIQSMKVNVAGLSFSDDLEVGASYSRYLSGTGISVNNLAAAYRLSSSAVVGVNVMSMSFGEIDVTDIDHPEGTGAKFKPSFLNFQLGFSKEFSERIRGGVAATFISEQIGNIGASGASIDAGVQYVDRNLHIGITLRNAGTNMRFSGGGFSSTSTAPNADYAFTRSTPQEKFQLPTYMSMGIAYDFYIAGRSASATEGKGDHRITAIGNFTSNSFNNDYLGIGAEYGFREMFMARAAFRYEKDIFDALKTTTFYTGISMGASVAAPLNKKGSKLYIDYSFRPTQRPANGVHVFGLRFNFASSDK
ncbi:MAG: PorV/PorQ family protein [Chitinophagaceae bacterium]